MNNKKPHDLLGINSIMEKGISLRSLSGKRCAGSTRKTHLKLDGERERKKVELVKIFQHEK
jgi:hypothetical protein